MTETSATSASDPPRTEPPTETVAEAELRLRDLVRDSALPVNLSRLSDGRTLEVSDPFVKFTGMDREALLSKRVVEYTQEPEIASASFALLASGALDGYTRRASFRRPDGEIVTFELRVSACTHPQPRQFAVATIVTLESPADPACAVDSAGGVEGLLIGTVDGQWRIDRITSAEDPALAFTPGQILGASAFVGIHPEDVGALLVLAAHATASAGGAFGRVRLAAREGGWVTRRIGLQQLTGDEPNGFAFAVWRETSRPQRYDPARRPMNDLHAALETTDAHPRAAGLAAWMAAFPTGLQVPELSTLTSREYEIVLRLASGDRVRTIATALHLSQSTVRNHLTSVFRKFKVHSQAELLVRLRPAAEPAGAAPVPRSHSNRPRQPE